MGFERGQQHFNKEMNTKQCKDDTFAIALKHKNWQVEHREICCRLVGTRLPQMLLLHCCSESVAIGPRLLKTIYFEVEFRRGW